MRSTSHASVEEWLRFHEGQLTLSRSQELQDGHLQCEVCRAAQDEAKALLERLLDVPPEVAKLDLVPSVIAAVAQPQRPAWRRWIWAPALASAVLVGFGLRNVQPEFRSKGAEVKTMDAWVGLEVYAVEGRVTRPLRGAAIQPCAALAFSYRNIEEARDFSRLMIFGVHERGEVYWYYPAYVDASSDPVSILVPISGGGALPDRISHDLEPGALRLYALFSGRPYSVKEIEALLKSVPSGGRLPLANTGQHIIRLEVAR